MTTIKESENHGFCRRTPTHPQYGQPYRNQKYTDFLPPTLLLQVFFEDEGGGGMGSQKLALKII
jgi:hypothetical protein